MAPRTSLKVSAQSQPVTTPTPTTPQPSAKEAAMLAKLAPPSTNPTLGQRDAFTDAIGDRLSKNTELVQNLEDVILADETKRRGPTQVLFDLLQSFPVAKDAQGHFKWSECELMTWPQADTKAPGMDKKGKDNPSGNRRSDWYSKPTGADLKPVDTSEIAEMFVKMDLALGENGIQHQINLLKKQKEQDTLSDSEVADLETRIDTLQSRIRRGGNTLRSAMELFEQIAHVHAEASDVVAIRFDTNVARGGKETLNTHTVENIVVVNKADVSKTKRFAAPAFKALDMEKAEKDKDGMSFRSVISSGTTKRGKGTPDGEEANLATEMAKFDIRSFQKAALLLGNFVDTPEKKSALVKMIDKSLSDPSDPWLVTIGDLFLTVSGIYGQITEWSNYGKEYRRRVEAKTGTNMKGEPTKGN